MKIRQGFVSNSSSSSFILVTKEPITEEFLRREYAQHGHFAEPTIQFLLHEGSADLHDLWDYEDRSGDRTPVDVWKDRHGVEEDAIVTEYLTSNWDEESNGRSEVARAIYYKGYNHLQTPNICVFHGTRDG